MCNASVYIVNGCPVSSINLKNKPMKTENLVYGACVKHPYQNMIDCPECDLEKFNESPDFTFNEWLKRRIEIDIPRFKQQNELAWIELVFYMMKHEDKGETEFKITPVGMNQGYKVSCLNYPRRKSKIIHDKS